MVDNNQHLIQIEIVFVSKDYEGNEFCGIFALKDGYCGIECKWTYNETTKTLEITGEEEMNDFTVDIVPWNAIKKDIQTVKINGITSIGNNAFKNCVNLERIIIGETVKTIRMNPFINCIKLREVEFERNEYFT